MYQNTWPSNDNMECQKQFCPCPVSVCKPIEDTQAYVAVKKAVALRTKVFRHWNHETLIHLIGEVLTKLYEH
jgi:hypothetical protein